MALFVVPFAVIVGWVLLGADGDRETGRGLELEAEGKLLGFLFGFRFLFIFVCF